MFIPLKLRKLTYFTRYDENEQESIIEIIDIKNEQTHNKVKPKAKVLKILKINKIMSVNKNKHFKNKSKILLWIFGIERETPKAAQLKTSKQINLLKEEDSYWSKINNTQAVFQLALCGFLWIFFNEFNNN